MKYSFLEGRKLCHDFITMRILREEFLALREKTGLKYG